MPPSATESNVDASRDATAVPAPALGAPRAASRDLAISLAALPCIGVAAAALFEGANMVVNRLSVYPVIKSLYFTLTIAFPGALLASSGVALGLALRRRDAVLKRSAWGLLGAAAAILAVRVYATHIEPSRLAVRRVTIASPKIQSPLRIVHISDIQTPAVRAYERRAVRTINELRPDLVIHTGDLLQPVRPATFQSERPRLDALLREIKAPLGVLNVTGDCDGPMNKHFRAGYGGMRTLFDEGVTIEAQGARLRLFGLTLDDSSGGAVTRQRVEDWLAAARPGEFTILLGHHPDFVASVQSLPIDLCLAGHTHGGQIRIPFYGPILTESRLPRELCRGFHRVGETWLNVSAAVGSEHIYELPAIRVNCPSELTVIDLTPAAKP